MFFFTFIYKLLILSLFVTISSTLLSTFKCTWTNPSPYFLYDDSSIECFSSDHNRYMIFSLIALIAYYPLSAYAMPNFQFAEKRLDLKYRPSYLVVYFQVNFVLLAGKVLISLASNLFYVEVLFISINIFALSILAISALRMKPCLIEWFNYIEFLSVVIGIIFNSAGLALYITKQWMICLISASSLIIISILLTVYFIRKHYFLKKVHNE
jgi:hypothetical protein